jgi:A/G-specific adenine glycosylase
LRHGREVLLRLRADGGIWGGLWSLPELPVPALPFDAEQAEDDALAFGRAFGTPARAAMVAEMTHVFTHFRLLIRAVRVDMAALALRDAAGEAAEQWRWLSLDRLDELGMPAPVRKLLAGQVLPQLF